MHFVMVVQLIEIVDEFLVIFDGKMCLKLFHIFYLIFVANQLLLHFTYYFITTLISLLHIGITTMKLFRLVTHIFE